MRVGCVVTEMMKSAVLISVWFSLSECVDGLLTVF